MELIQQFENFWDFTDPFVNFWISIFHLPDDMMRISILLIASYLAAILHRNFLASYTARLYFSLFTGLFWCFFCFKWDALHYIGISLFTYLACRFLPTKQAPRIVLIATFAHLSYGHYTRFTYLYLKYTVNWATPMMLMCIKLQSYAWSYYDGHHNGEVNPAFPAKNKITREPSLVEFFSYIFFFAGFLTGPVGEFNDYISFTDRTMFAQEKDGAIPDSYIPALKKFALMFLGIIGFYSSRIISEHYCTTDAYDLEPFWYRALYAVVAVEIGFTKYYFAWFNGEAVTILIGFSYNGRDKNGNVLWTRARMLELLPFKLASSRFDIATYWNICSGEWLKYYIYLRVPISIRKVVSPIIITFGVSAFWHGFYPGYYLFFGFYAFYYFVEEAIDKNFKQVYIMKDRYTPKNPTYYLIYKIVMTLATYIYINTITVSFRVLEFSGSIKAWSSIYFYVHVIAAVIYVYFKIFPYKRPPPPQKSE